MHKQEQKAKENPEKIIAGSGSTSGFGGPINYQ